MNLSAKWKNRIWFGLLLLPLLVLIGWSISLAYDSSRGREVEVMIRGYDPRDLFAGRYLAFAIDWDKTDCQQFPGKTCPQDDFCQMSFRESCRFYVPEEDADQLDRLLQQASPLLNDPASPGSAAKPSLQFSVIYAYRPGKTPLAKQLRINGQDYKTWQQAHLETSTPQNAERPLNQN